MSHNKSLLCEYNPLHQVTHSSHYVQLQLCKYFSAGVTIGFRQKDVSVNENVGVVLICAVTKCGCVRRDVEVNLFTQDGTAAGMLWNTTYPEFVARLVPALLHKN